MLNKEKAGCIYLLQAFLTLYLIWVIIYSVNSRGRVPTLSWFCMSYSVAKDLGSPPLLNKGLNRALSFYIMKQLIE